MNGGSLQKLIRSMDDKQKCRPRAQPMNSRPVNVVRFSGGPPLAPIFFILQQDLAVRADTGCEMRTGEGPDAGKRDRWVNFL